MIHTFIRQVALFVAVPLFLSCTTGQERVLAEFTIENPHPFEVKNAPVVFEPGTLWMGSSGKHLAVLQSVNGAWAEIPSQTDNFAVSGGRHEIFFLTHLPASSTGTFRIVVRDAAPEYAQRTQAFLKVQSGGRFENGVYAAGTGYELADRLEIPNEQIQDSKWPYMEGPVWESDLVGYRFYLDARNRVDIFGKSMPDLVLDTITTNYHLIHDWGTDVLKVGQSLGLGSPGVIRGNEVKVIDNWSGRTFEVLANGPLRSVIRTTYHDWRVFERTLTVVSDIEIHAGNRYSEQRLSVSGVTADLTFVTGIVKHPEATPLTTGETEGAVFGWTGGMQSDQGHALLMNLVVPKVYQPEIIRTNPLSYLFTFRLDQNGEARYRYASAWAFDHEPVGDFGRYTTRLADLFTHPLQVDP